MEFFLRAMPHSSLSCGLLSLAERPFVRILIGHFCGAALSTCAVRNRVNRHNRNRPVAGMHSDE